MNKGLGTSGQEERDQGFTLVELLVVMIIIGVLASIAIPVFSKSRQRARDTATKADVSLIAKAVTARQIDGDRALTIGLQPGRFVLTDSGSSPASCTGQAGYCVEGSLSDGVGAPSAGSSSTSLGVGVNWCLSLGNPQGDYKDYRYTPSSGVSPGTC